MQFQADMALCLALSYNNKGDFMINYPNGKKQISQAFTKDSVSRRGMSLENDLNQSNNYYLDLNIANIHKKPTPVTIVHVDYPSRNKAKRDEAYFKTPSTTDYNGVYRQKAIDFEAKECNDIARFPFASIHKHQIEHLQSVLHHGAVAFLILRFKAHDETYLIKAKDIITMYYGEKKSISYSWVKENGHLIKMGLTPPLDYLKVVDRVFFDEVTYDRDK